MTDKKVSDGRIGKLMAAVSVLGLSLGMTAQAASDQHKIDTTGASTQIKDGTTHLKGTSTQIKNGTTQVKGVSHQGKFTNTIKHNTATGASTQIKLDQAGSSTQIKIDATHSTQQKHDVPSTQLNPQPEPPKPSGSGPH